MFQVTGKNATYDYTIFEIILQIIIIQLVIYAIIASNMAVILETSLGDLTVDLYTDERPNCE